MSERRRRLTLAIVVGVVVTLAAGLPLLAWRAELRHRIDTDLEAEAKALMDDVLGAWVRDETPTDVLGWQVNVAPEEWATPFTETDVELPLVKWMREADGWPTFRTYSLQYEGTFLAYIRPIDASFGFVTVVDRYDHDEQVAALQRATIGVGVGLPIVALGIGWLLSGWALGGARRAVREREAFLADAAHEMRTPLAVILASSSQALARPRSTEEYVRSLAEIRSAAERASAGVNELLDLARFESGQVIPRLAPLRLDLLAEEVAASTRHDDGTVTALPGEPVVVAADMSLLRQALDNLVRNAVRRARAVELLTRRDGTDGVVEVRDDGPGFDPAMVEQVFDRYRRGDRRGDAGMGLAIVRAIAAVHGGAVVAANRAEGGAVVALRIPLARHGADH